MFDSTNHIAPDLRPIDRRVQLLVQQAADGHILPADQVKAMSDFFAVVWIVGRADDALDRVLQDQVGDLVAREQRTREGAAVCGDHEDFFCKKKGNVSGSLYAPNDQAGENIYEIFVQM